MNENFARSNFRFLALALAGNSLLAIFFLLLSWAIGGSSYFKDVLQGESMVTILAILTAIGAIGAYFLGSRETREATILKAA